MRGYPPFSFWIPVAHTKKSHKLRKNTSVLVVTVLKASCNLVPLALKGDDSVLEASLRFRRTHG